MAAEWPEGEKEPTKYWLSALPNDISFHRLVDYAKLRWLIERDYEELKQEVGLGDFEGRGWRGFHHHATLSIAVYGFLISEREVFPPSRPLAEMLIQKFAIPHGYRQLGIARKCNRCIKGLMRRDYLSTNNYRKYSSARNLTRKIAPESAGTGVAWVCGEARMLACALNRRLAWRRLMGDA